MHCRIAAAALSYVLTICCLVITILYNRAALYPMIGFSIICVVLTLSVAPTLLEEKLDRIVVHLPEVTVTIEEECNSLSQDGQLSQDGPNSLTHTGVAPL